MLGGSRRGVKHTAGRGIRATPTKDSRHLSSLAVPHLEVDVILDIRMAGLVQDEGDLVVADPT
jgi:hypothetical protein